MVSRLKSLAAKLWPGLETLDGPDYMAGLFNVTGLLYAAPIALLGLGWLVFATDLTVIRAEWPKLAFLLVLQFVFERLRFFFLIEVTPGVFHDWQASLDSVITWSAALVFGPTALWPAILYGLVHRALEWGRAPSIERRWSNARNFVFNRTRVLTSLIALALYQRWTGGGTLGSALPLPGLALESILPGLLATVVWWLLPALIWLPILVFFERLRPAPLTGAARRANLTFWAGALGWQGLVGPFAVLAAGLYAQNGVGGYLFLISGLLLASLLAHSLSQAVERSQQRSRELGRLEQLGRAILNAPPDASTLPDVLREHVSNMFPHSFMEIYVESEPLFPAQTLLRHLAEGALMPRDRMAVGASTWEWLRAASEAHCFLPGQPLPWGEQPLGEAVVVAPILDVESTEPIGGIYLLRTWRPKGATNLVPAVQSLAAQIASALHGARVYAQTLDHQRVEQELALAWQIQESFLPDHLPDIPGWQLAATLKPARETSGDFYDVIPLPDGRLGILIADVADKGMAAALYMALSRTLIRTYAAEYTTQPELVLRGASRRILMDTRADLFVTVFYGILDPVAGMLTYCNAGHNPPYLLSARDGHAVQSMPRTGMPLGIAEDAEWGREDVQIAPGDVLVLYTDGVTDAQDAQGEFFGDERLLHAVRAGWTRQVSLQSSAEHGALAETMQEALTAEIHRFVGDAPQFDDITLMILFRES